VSTKSFKSLFVSSATALSAVTSTPGITKFIVDSGATDTFVNDPKLLSHTYPLQEKIQVAVGDNRMLPATMRGVLKIGPVQYRDALAVPNLKHNLLSVRRQKQRDTQWEFTDTECRLVELGTQKILLRGHSVGDLFVIETVGTGGKLKLVNPPQHALITTVDILSWHRRRGHLNQMAVWELGRAGRLGDVWKGSYTPAECNDCVMGKGARDTPRFITLMRAVWISRL
jgi:hypothetical protein